MSSTDQDPVSGGRLLPPALRGQLGRDQYMACNRKIAEPLRCSLFGISSGFLMVSRSDHHGAGKHVELFNWANPRSIASKRRAFGQIPLARFCHTCLAVVLGRGRSALQLCAGSEASGASNILCSVIYHATRKPCRTCHT